MFEKRMLTRICAPQMYKEERRWTKLYNEELCDLNSSPNKIRIIKSRRMTWSGHLARMGEKRNVYNILIGKLEGKRLLGRPGRRLAENNKVDLEAILW
jgi:hypothetical protein